MNPTLFCGLLLWVAALTGCQTRVSGGAQVHPEMVNSLMAGLSYREVISELGEPYDYLSGEQVVAYRWTTNKGYRTTTWMGRELTATENSPHAFALCLRFDDRQLLQSWVVIEAQYTDQLRPKMNQWMASTGPVSAVTANASKGGAGNPPSINIAAQ